MTKNILFFGLLSLVAAEQEGLRLMSVNPLLRELGDVLVADEAPLASAAVPRVFDPIERNLFMLYTYSPKELRDKAGREQNSIQFLAGLGLGIEGKVKDPKPGIVLNKCSHEAFLRSIDGVLGKFSKSRVAPEGFPLLQRPVTFICGAQSLESSAPEFLTFRPLFSQASGFSSILNALTAVAFFKGNKEEASSIAQFLKGIMGAGQGVVCHEEQADFSALSDKERTKAIKAYTKDMATVYPTDMTSEQVEALLVNKERVWKIAYNTCAGIEGYKALIRSAVLSTFVSTLAKPSVAHVRTVARVIGEECTDLFGNDSTQFTSVAMAYYPETKQVVGTILDPNRVISPYRIEAIQGLVYEVARRLNEQK